MHLIRGNPCIGSYIGSEYRNVVDLCLLSGDEAHTSKIVNVQPSLLDAKCSDSQAI